MTITTFTTAVTTPLGVLVLASDGDHLTGVVLPTSRVVPRGRSGGAIRVLCDAVEQLRAYVARERTTFDLPTRWAGTAFQRAVWSQLERIPYGDTVTYGELARRVGRPGAARAVGRANASNPLPLVVPCHRVVASNGLGGYAGGVAMKRALLDIERRR